MGCAFKNMPGQPCCTDACRLLTADFTSLAAIKDEWNLRAGSWSDVSGTGMELELAAGGVELLAIQEPMLSPFGVQLSATAKGRDGSVIRFFAGADYDVAVVAEVTLGEHCGQVRFYEQAVGSETRIGDVHWVRELDAERWHRFRLCYDPTHGYLSLRVATAADEVWTYTVRVQGTGLAGYGLGTATSTAEFKNVFASASGETLPPCADVTVVTTRQGAATSDYSIVLSFASDNFSETISLYRPDGGGIPQTTVYASSGKTEAQVASEIMSWLVVASGNLGYYSTFTVVFQRGSSDCTLTVTPDPAGAYAGDLTGIDWLTITNAIRDDIYGINEIQAVTLTGYTTGTFTLTLDGQTTTDLAATAGAATVQAALENLSSIGAGNVTVTGTAGAWVVEFVGALAKTNVSEMTAASSLTSCGSYGYYYTIKCPTCAPGCDLAGSPFSATLSACDWDATGWTFGAGTATGTGTITHLAEIWTTPYVYRAAVASLAYDYHVDFVIDATTLTLQWRRALSGDNWQYYLDAVIGATTLQSWNMGVFAGDPDPATTISIQVCRHDEILLLDMTVGGVRAVKETTCSTLSGPQYIGLDTDQPDTVVTSLRATRHEAFAHGCGTCGACQACDDAEMLPDVIYADLTACVFVSNGCEFCPSIAAVWPMVWDGSGTSCVWRGGVLNVCTKTSIPSYFYLTLTMESGTAPGSKKLHLEFGIFALTDPGGPEVYTWRGDYYSEDFSTSDCNSLPTVLTFSHGLVNGVQADDAGDACQGSFEVFPNTVTVQA